LCILVAGCGGPESHEERMSTMLRVVGRNADPAGGEAIHMWIELGASGTLPRSAPPAADGEEACPQCRPDNSIDPGATLRLLDRTYHVARNPLPRYVRVCCGRTDVGLVGEQTVTLPRQSDQGTHAQPAGVTVGAVYSEEHGLVVDRDTHERSDDDSTDWSFADA
jgi:hypothetical protein